jgi:hypothetical protein
VEDPKQQLKAANLIIWCGILEIPVSLVGFMFHVRQPSEPFWEAVLTSPFTFFTMGVVLLVLGICKHRYWKAREKNAP